MHLDDGSCYHLHGSLLVGGQDIAYGCFVIYLGNGILANLQVLNEDFAVFAGSKGLVVVHARDTEREALQCAVRGCFDDFQRAFLGGIDEANICLVLHGLGLAVFLNRYGINILIKHKACRGDLFTDKIFAVTEFFHLVDAALKFGHYAKQ